MTKEQQDEAAECVAFVHNGLTDTASAVTRNVARTALARLSDLIAGGHTAASHGKPKRTRKKKGETPAASGGGSGA